LKTENFPLSLSLKNSKKPKTWFGTRWSATWVSHAGVRLFGEREGGPPNPERLTVVQGQHTSSSSHQSHLIVSKLMFSLYVHLDLTPTAVKRRQIDNSHIDPPFLVGHNSNTSSLSIDFALMRNKPLYILFVALVATGCHASHNQISDLPSQEVDNSQTSSGSSPEAYFSTSGWRIYSDSFISFKYPPDWNTVLKREDNDGSFTISLLRTPKDQVNPIQVSFRKDTFNGSIKRLFPDDAVQRTIQDRRIEIDGQLAYLLRGPFSGGFKDTRVVFTNNLVFIFDSNARSVATSTDAEQNIEKVFDTVLSTVHF
jgi:hypothetical protein